MENSGCNDYGNINSKIKINSHEENLALYIIRVYGYMAVTLLVTGIAALLISSCKFCTDLIYEIHDLELIKFSALGLIILLSLLALIYMLKALVFIGLTAADTQKIHNYTYERNYKEITTKLSIFRALISFLSFINIFAHLLKLFSKDRER